MSAGPAAQLPLVACEPYGARLTLRACVARWRGRCGEANFWLGVGRANTVKCVDCGAGRQRAEGEGEGEGAATTLQPAPAPTAEPRVRVKAMVRDTSADTRPPQIVSPANAGAGMTGTSATTAAIEGEGEGDQLPLCRCGCGREVRREGNLYAELACWRRHRMATLVDQVCTECGATYQCPQAVHHLRMFCDPCGEARRAGRNRTEENR